MTASSGNSSGIGRRGTDSTIAQPATTTTQPAMYSGSSSESVGCRAHRRAADRPGDQQHRGNGGGFGAGHAVMRSQKRHAHRLEKASIGPAIPPAVKNSSQLLR